MTNTKKSVEDALKDVHTFLNHPLKGGRLYTTYDKDGVKSALKVLFHCVSVLEGKQNDE